MSDRQSCLFCRIVDGELPSTRLHEDDLVIAIRDIAPEAPTHILLMPRAHIASAAELSDADAPLLGRLFAVAADLARAEGIADAGYRLVTNVGTGRPDRRPPPRPPHGRSPVPTGRPGEAARGRSAVVLGAFAGASSCRVVASRRARRATAHR